MRLIAWNNLASGSELPNQTLAPNANELELWFTVVVGNNGSRKSVLLRLLLEGTLQTPTFRIGTNKTIRPAVDFVQGEPARVIAISGTPFDRFPRKALYQVSNLPNRYDRDSRYVYLGTRAANGTPGIAHGVRTLTHLLLSTSIEDLNSELGTPFDHLGLEPWISISLRRSPLIQPNQRTTKADKSEEASVSEIDDQKLNEALARWQTRIHKEMQGSNAALFNSFVSISPDEAKVFLSQLPSKIEFDLTNPTSFHTQTPKARKELLTLLAAGLVVPSKLKVRALKNGGGKESDESELSSGQWQMLSSLLGLALTVVPNSLVLVDEPENSLHPGWQRDFLGLISKILKNVSGCHVVIATHSPLIASSVPTGQGNVLHLSPKSESPLGVECIELGAAFGWNVSDVYHEIFSLQSTRAPSFLELTDEALALIRDGKQRSERVREVLKLLSPSVEALPTDDPMRLIVNAIDRASSVQRN